MAFKHCYLTDANGCYILTTDGCRMRVSLSLGMGMPKQPQPDRIAEEDEELMVFVAAFMEIAA